MNERRREGGGQPAGSGPRAADSRRDARPARGDTRDRGGQPAASRSTTTGVGPGTGAVPPARDRPTEELFQPAAMGKLAPLAPTEEFLAKCREAGVEFEGDDLARLGKYLAILLDANTKVNLTAIDDPAQAWVRHVFDSLTLLPLLAEIGDEGTVIDVGSGGGLPGMVLAIVLPRLKFTLLEATGKKAMFLRLAARELGLKNVTVAADRAESAGHDRGRKVSEGPRTIRVGGHREKYDLVTARAVGRLAMLAELTMPLAKVGGRVALIKGQQAEDELSEAAAALHLLKAIHTGTIETPTGRIVVLEKSSATPRDYPRRDGEPKRAPLGVVREKDRDAGPPTKLEDGSKKPGAARKQP